MGAIFCNSHTGYDGWSFEESLQVFTTCLELEKEYNIIVCHETHRRRILYNPWVCKKLLQALPDIKICADLSHWFNVVEDTLDDELDIIELVGRHCILIHSRVGHSQGPQVSDPRAPEWLPWVEAHERCWEIIWKGMKEVGRPLIYLEPEFGPPPYCPTLPYTNVPVTDVWEVCEWFIKRLVDKYEKGGGVVLKN